MNTNANTVYLYRDIPYFTEQFFRIRPYILGLLFIQRKNFLLLMRVCSARKAFSRIALELSREADDLSAPAALQMPPFLPASPVLHGVSALPLKRARPRRDLFVE